MRVYELKPISEASDDWEAGEYKGTVIVRAQDEKSARLKALFVFFTLTKEDPGRDTPILPWNDDKFVICKQLDKSVLDKLGYEEEGPEEILFPKDVTERMQLSLKDSSLNL